MTCETCKNLKVYTTGMDEYPPCCTLAYCAKGHWENGSQYDDYTEEINCPDFELKEPKVTL